MKRSRQIALVSRELFPFGGGGIGEYIAACARVLAAWSEVTVFTSSIHQERYAALRADNDPRLLPDEIHVVFVPEVASCEQGSFFSDSHLYSARILDRMREHYGAVGPNLVEFSDYLGEGAVVAQARSAGSRFLRDTIVAIRLHTSAEVCAVLDGYISGDWPARMTCELERLAMRDADYLVWPGGDTLSFYQRFYGEGAIAPSVMIRNPTLTRVAVASDELEKADMGLRLLYLGRLERRKGVQSLVRAINFLDSEHISLDILGGDTDTAPLGQSMRRHLSMVAANDSRVQFLEPVPREELAGLITSHDAVVLPSLWEAWPYVGLESLRLNRPILATPVGGFTELVQDGRSGWLASNTTSIGLVELIERCLFDRRAHEEIVRSQGPRSVFDELTDPEQISNSYHALLERGGRWTTTGAPDFCAASPKAEVASKSDTLQRSARVAPACGAALVSVIIPYYKMARYVEETVRSVISQSHPRIEIIVVNDGSAERSDWILAELAVRYQLQVVTQINSGLGAARNFGVSQARGRYVVPLDADNMIEPDFIARAIEVMRHRPTAAYVTSWSRYVDENDVPLAEDMTGYQPLGNVGPGVLRDNLAGDAIALIPKRLFDAGLRYSEELTSYEDWQLYQRLHRERRYGVVIPERLIRYRVRQNSMIRDIGFPNLGRLEGELHALRREEEVEWLFKSA